LSAPIAAAPVKAEVQPEAPEPDTSNDDPDGAPRRGWWQRTFGA